MSNEKKLKQQIKFWCRGNSLRCKTFAVKFQALGVLAVAFLLCRGGLVVVVSTVAAAGVISSAALQKKEKKKEME